MEYLNFSPSENRNNSFVHNNICNFSSQFSTAFLFAAGNSKTKVITLLQREVLRIESVRVIMSNHHRDFDKAQCSRWNYLHVSTEGRNILNRDVQIEDLTLHTQVNQGRELIKGSPLTLLRGRKYGLVGRNGVGKTTLLKAIANRQVMGVFDHLRIAYVDDGTDVLIENGNCDKGVTVLSYLLAQHKERVRLQVQLKELLEGEADVDMREYEFVTESLRHLGDADADSRAHKILDGLQLDGDQLMSELSGGWRHRAALAVALFLEVDILLLDEPTNHLDIHSIMWLEEYIKACQCTVVVVSHDYHFIDAFATHMISFENEALKYYDGNFSDYVYAKQQHLQKQKRMFLAQEKRRRAMQQTIERLQQKAQSSLTGKGFGAIRSRQQQLKHRLGADLDGRYWKYSLMGPRPEILAPIEEEPFEFDFATDVSDVPDATGEGETTLIEARKASYSFSTDDTTPPLFRQVDMTVTLSSRIGIIGQNGSGKTTLLKVLFGSLDATTGDVIRWLGLRASFFEQHAVKTLRSTSPALSWLCEKHQELTLPEARNLLGRLGLIGLIAEETPVSNLSDGQRARVLFASMLAVRPHVLFLDEPTSHLDAETAAAVTAAVVEFDGGVVVASHDRTFIDETTTERFCLDKFAFGPFEKSFAEYKDLVLAGSRQCQLPTENMSGAQATPGVSTTCQSEVSAEEKQALAETSVKCRHCQGGHFTHSCPVKKTSAKSLALHDEQVRQQLEAEAMKKATKVVVPTVKVKSTDGQGDWTVAMSKTAKRRIIEQQKK